MSQFTHYPPVSDKQLGFFIDSSRCSGCKACQVACKDKNNLEVGRRFRRVYEVKGGSFIPTGQGGVSNNVFAYTLSISCNHCADPVCTKNCPTTAMHKRPGDGIVRVDTDKCVGCGYCAWSCPYGAPQLNEQTGQMSKCDMCVDLLAKGEQPVCVATCPLEAIKFGPIDELRAKYLIWLSKRIRAQKKRVNAMHELPLLIFTLCLQGSVGVTLWLALGRQYAVEGRVPARGALPAMVGAFVLACVGLLASALHMGYPLNALNALRHVASSWLSREIVFASLYLAALGLGVVLLFFRKPGWQPLLALAAAFGLVDVFCMAQVYIHASVATWQHSNTLALFFGTSGIIGSVVIALAYLRNAGAAMRCAVVVVALMVLIRLIMQPLWLAVLQALAQLRDVYLLGWCVSAAGALLAAGGLRNARGTLVAGSVLLLIGEIMLRYVFFSIG